MILAVRSRAQHGIMDLQPIHRPTGSAEPTAGVDCAPIARMLTEEIVWVGNSGLFAFAPPEDFDPNGGTNPTNKIWLVEILMVAVLVILLNLLIAIMGSSYEKVHAVAELEVAREKSLIILDIERFLLPVYIKWFKKDVDELFPRWLHVLVPVSMIESEGQTSASQK